MPPIATTPAPATEPSAPPAPPATAQPAQPPSDTYEVITTSDGRVHVGTTVRELEHGLLFRESNGATVVLDYSSIQQVQKTVPAAQTALPPPIAYYPAAPPPPAQGLTLEPRQHHLVDVNVVGFLGGNLSVDVEQVVSPLLSVVITPEIYFWSGVGGPNVSMLGLGLGLGLHFFPFNAAPGGFWAGPDAEVAYIGLSNGAVSGSGAAFALYGAAGYTFIVGNHFSIALGLGLGAQIGAVTLADANGNTVASTGSGFAISGRLGLGYTW